MHITAVELHPDRFPDRSQYPFSLPVLQRTRTIALPGPVTFFLGENGSGKSTVLRAISRRCGIHIWSEAPQGRVQRSPYEDSLHQHLDVCWRAGEKPGAFFSAETYQHLSQMIDEWASLDPDLLGYFGGKSLVSQSHGESFMSFFASRFVREGVYLLDEPESALSPRRQLAFVRLLQDMARDGHAQFLIASHSPILLSCPDAALLSFDGPAVAPVRFEDTDYCRVYRELLGGGRCR